MTTASDESSRIGRLIDEKRFAEAEAAAKRLLPDPDGHLTAVALLARSALLRGDVPQSLRYADRGLRLCPDDPNINLLQGLGLFRAGDFGAALRAFEKAEESGPRGQETFSAKIQCHLRLGNPFRCLEEADAFVRTTPLGDGAARQMAELFAAMFPALPAGVVWSEENGDLAGLVHAPAGCDAAFELFSGGDGAVFERLVPGADSARTAWSGIAAASATFRTSLPAKSLHEEIGVRFTKSGASFLGSPAPVPKIRRSCFEGRVEVRDARLIMGFAANIFDPAEKVRVRLRRDSGEERTILADKKTRGEGMARKYGPFHGFSLNWKLSGTDPLFVVVEAAMGEGDVPLLGSPVVVTDALRLDRARHLFSKWLRMVEKDPSVPLAEFPDLCVPGALRYLRALSFA